MKILPTQISEAGPGIDLSNLPDGLSVVFDDPNPDLAYTRNALTLTFDLSTIEQVKLQFEAKEFGDEPHAPPPSPFGDEAHFDGVAISGDGQDWYEARGLRDLSSQRFLPIEIDLDAAIAQAGLFYTEDFRVRFCQYDNMPRRMDGITIHGIQLTGEPLEVDPSLVLHLPMDDNAPNPIVRDKTRKHHQTFLDPGGNPNTDGHTAPGAVGTGLAFDGVDDQINLGTDIVDLAGPFSISFWFATNNSKSQFLFGRAKGATAPGLIIFVSSSGAITASLTDDNEDAPYIVAQGAYDFTGYAHLAVVRSDTQLKLYVDGVLRGERDLSLSTITPDSLRIANYAGFFAECTIDDFRVNDRALDLDEIETLHQLAED